MSIGSVTNAFPLLMSGAKGIWERRALVDVRFHHPKEGGQGREGRTNRFATPRDPPGDGVPPLSSCESLAMSAPPASVAIYTLPLLASG